MFRSTFSTTTIASSTTIPMASTMPNSDSALIEKPNASSSENVPTIDTGTASNGMIDARQVCRNTITTITTSAIASSSVWIDRLDTRAHELRRVVDDLVFDACRHVLLQFLHRGAHLVGDLQRVRARLLEDDDRDRRLVVEQRTQAVFRRRQFDARNVAQMRHARRPATS